MKIAFLFIAMFGLTACADKGKCLEEKLEYRQPYTWVQIIPTGNGAMIPVTHHVPGGYEKVCKRWEFPDGKPKEKISGN